ncbi:MAG: hypothetical protein ACM3OC_03405 [Deltaproteobacteria bacterium]
MGRKAKNQIKKTRVVTKKSKLHTSGVRYLFDYPMLYRDEDTEGLYFKDDHIEPELFEGDDYWW